MIAGVFFTRLTVRQALAWEGLNALVGSFGWYIVWFQIAGSDNLALGILVGMVGPILGMAWVVSVLAPPVALLYRAVLVLSRHFTTRSILIATLPVVIAVNAVAVLLLFLQATRSMGDSAAPMLLSVQNNTDAPVDVVVYERTGQTTPVILYAGAKTLQTFTAGAKRVEAYDSDGDRIYCKVITAADLRQEPGVKADVVHIVIPTAPPVSATPSSLGC